MKSFTELVGTTTPNAFPGSFCDLTQNNTATNVGLGGVLINTQHRYYLQKYFDNERTYNTLTIGAEDLTLTGGLSTNATSATLSSAWNKQTVQQFVVFSNGDQRNVLFTQGLTSISWQGGLTASATSAISTVGVQAYPIPPNVSKIKNNTITVGQLVYTPAPVQTIDEWTRINALPYTSDIPAYYFIYRTAYFNTVQFWPIPSTAGNLITFNYKSAIPDMTYANYGTGTVAISGGSNSITGTSTSWNTTGLFPLNTDLSFANLKIKILPPRGDGLYYPIQRFSSDTNLILNQSIVDAPVSSGNSYVIGQYPLLQEDFHDILLYSSLMVYYSSIVKDQQLYSLYKDMTEVRERLMSDYLGTKSVNVDLGQQPIQRNPNLFIFAPPQ